MPAGQPLQAGQRGLRHQNADTRCARYYLDGHLALVGGDHVLLHRVCTCLHSLTIFLCAYII